MTMREAMARAGLKPEEIAKIRRDPSKYLGFVEVHIEQGPVLNELDNDGSQQPGIVDGVNPTGTLTQGDSVTISYWVPAPETPTPTPTPTTAAPSDTTSPAATPTQEATP